MTSIIFKVTDKPIDPIRLGSEVVFDANSMDDVLTEFKMPEPIFNRTYAASMDGSDGRGTLVSSHEVSRIGFTLKIERLPEFNEMIYSLANYQIAEFDSSEVNFAPTIRRFRMMGTNFPRLTIGCDYFSGAFDIRYLD